MDDPSTVFDAAFWTTAGVILFLLVLSGFFSGISRTGVVMWSNLLITLINLVMDYLLIFGRWGLPAMGVA